MDVASDAPAAFTECSDVDDLMPEPFDDPAGR
jgi:hypothetical protein